MDDFFRVAHNDMQACMEQLLNLRFADHSATIEEGRIATKNLIIDLINYIIIKLN